MKAIESNLFIDPQRKPSRSCLICGGCTYAPSYHCIRCRRRRP